MRELMRTNDLVRLSWLKALLASAGIEAVVLDDHTSIMEGSIGAIPAASWSTRRMRNAPGL